MAHDVFISYSSADKTIADAACAKLEQHRIRCWIAPRDVTPGANYAGEIVEAITKSRLLVLILSSHSNTSNHVLREVERAVNKSLPILPFRVEQIALSQNLEYFLSTPHWLDAITPPVEKHLDHLLGTVELLLSRATRGTTPLQTPATSEQTSPWVSGKEPAKGVTKLLAWKTVIGAAAVIATVLCVYLLIAQFFPEPNDNPEGTPKQDQIDVPVLVNQPAAEPAQVVHGDVLRDNDYAFEITRPSSEWRFFTEDEIVGINPNACAGVLNFKRQCIFMVISEQLPNVTLFEYTEHQLQSLPLTDKKEEGPGSIELAGQPAKQAIVSGKIQDTIEFTFLITVIKQGDWFFQLLGQVPGPELGEAEEDLRAITNSFVFLPGHDPRFRSPNFKLSEQYGIDWRILDGKYENASLGYRFTAGPGWRYALTTERVQLAPGADVTVFCQQPFMTQSLFSERLGTDSLETVRERYLRQMEENLTLGKPNETSKINMGGLSGNQLIYYDVDASGIKSDYAYAVLNGIDGTMLQVRTMWESRDRAVALEKLADSHQFFSMLSRNETAVLEQELRRVDADNAVGRTYSLRGGVFQDFEHGVIFRRPTEGLWGLTVGADAKAALPGAVLVAECRRLGILILLKPENIPGLPHDVYHEILIPRATNPTETRTQTFGDLEFKITQIDQEIESVMYTDYLVTTVKDDRHVQLVIHGLRESMSDKQNLLPSIIECLSIPEAPPVPTVVKSTSYRDYRLGYEFSTTLSGYQLETPSLPFGMDSFASCAGLYDDSDICMVMAICVPDFVEKLAIEQLIQSNGISEFNLDDQTESVDSLAGLPAKRINSVGRRDGSRVAFTVCTIRRGQTSYALIAIRERGQSDAEDEQVLLNKYFKFFSLLPEGAVANK